MGGYRIMDKSTVIQLAQVLFDRKGQDIAVLNVSHLTVLCDCMVIASGRNPIHVSALSDAAQEFMSEKGIILRRCEGLRDGRWAVLDYGHIIIHIFHRDERSFYSLDRLWNDGTNAIELPFDQTSEA